MSAPRLEHLIYREIGENWVQMDRWFGSTPKNVLNDWAVKKEPVPGRYKAKGEAGEHVGRIW